MRLGLLTLCFVLASLPAMAQEPSLEVSREACSWAMVEYKMPEGVELNSSPISSAFTVNLTQDLATKLGLPTDIYASELQIGTIELVDGALTFNGQPLENPDQAALAEACRSATP